MKHFVFFLAVMAFVAASCAEISTKEVEEALKNPLELMPLTDVSTKAAIDGTVFPNDRTLVVSAYYNAERGDSGNYFSNTTFSRNSSNGRWVAANPKFWPFSGTLDIFAYSCDGLTQSDRTYLSKVTDGVTVTLSDNRTTQTDVLFGHVAANSRVETGNPMTMRHAEALLVFTASSVVDYNETMNFGITINSITVENAYYSGRLAVNATADLYSQCTWDNLGSQGNKALPSNNVSGVKLPYNVPNTSVSVTSSAAWHMGIGGIGILVPEQPQTRLYIEYTLHNGRDEQGNPVNNSMTHHWDCTGDWTEGHKYVYDLQFIYNEIRVVPTILAWDDGGTVEQILPEPDPANGYAYVDLGLRSGGNKILFATMNIGASAPQEYGDFFAWGETSKRYTSIVALSNITIFDGGSFVQNNAPYYSGSTYTKYNTTDNKLTLDAADDVASVMWGGEWRMPDKADLEFLLNSTYCTAARTANYNSTGVAGIVVTGKNDYAGNSIFLPAAGRGVNDSVFGAGDYGYYWSRSRYESPASLAYSLNFSESSRSVGNNFRYYGCSVRPVLVIPE